MVKIRCRIRPMTASGDPRQLSHSLGVAVIGLGYLGAEPGAQFCRSEHCPGRSLSVPLSPGMLRWAPL
jgi:hypothetical protein